MAKGLPAPSLGISEVYIPPDTQRNVAADSRVQQIIAMEPHQVEVYYSEEELKKRVAAREAARGSFPPPMVLRFNDDVS